ncbi:SOS response-associated peptidase [Novosphingobium sp. JCM 18896]|uniref:SOS response-associated peptidase n=1 Tax=Novosphingobium sp. JCM 18896 TaxID=2989731 RepID=UPI002222602C|nr:SOS response-associated peptidase [Novosphingobium sp. JCM 18896]MCW1430331.1 SOS response-associated peptidase [Novosphingobium sp. JCM 18896]
MTLLYRLDAPAAAIAAHFQASAGADPWAGGHVSPGRFAPVVTTGREFVAGPRPEGSRTRRMIPRLWGVPPPASAGDPSRAIATLRNLDSPFWIGNLRNSEFRCLVPATGFMEWGPIEHKGGVTHEGKRRQHWIACADQPLFAFAAVWKDSEVPSFALVTCSANAALREIGRETMPAILPADPAAQHVWLNGGWDRARDLIEPYASGMTEIRGL